MGYNYDGTVLHIFPKNKKNLVSKLITSIIHPVKKLQSTKKIKNKKIQVVDVLIKRIP
jgi:hypothetical protein